MADTDVDMPIAPPLTLGDLPYECLVECLSHLGSASELARVALVSTALHEATQADFLWRGLCVSGQHGQVLDFKESLGEFRHPDAKPLMAQDVAAPPIATTASASSAGSQPDWRNVYRRSLDSLRTTICIDTGRGYAKYGFAIAERPSVIQICEPGAEASQESLYATSFRRLGLQRADMKQHAVIVSEPYRLAAEANARERAAWRFETERRILQGYQLKELCIVDSASLCLFANNFTSGVVVNIGFGMTFVVPVLRGHVIRPAVQTMRLGGATLTQAFSELLQVCGADLRWRPELGGDRIAPVTVARNLKERGCEVHATPLRRLVGAGQSPFSIAALLNLPHEPKTVRLGSVDFALGMERFVPGEMLFER